MGSALAAISSAFLLSTLGVAGTVIGAALASVVATVGSAVYVHLFRKTGEQLRDVRAQLVPAHEGGPSPDPSGVPDRPTGVAQPRPALDETVLLPVGEYEPAGRPAALDPVTEPGARPDPAGGKPVWFVRSLVAAVVVFVVAMAAVTLTETALGRSFASLFGHDDKGGSTISRFVDDTKPAGNDSPKKPADTTPGSTPSSTSRSSESPGTQGDRDKDKTGTATSTPSPSSTPSTRPDGTGAPNPGGGSTPSTEPTTTPTAPAQTSPPAGGGQGADAGTGQNAGKDAGKGTDQNANPGADADTRRVPAP